MISPSSSRLPRVAALVLCLTLLIPSIVLADDTIPDGDGATPVASSTLEFDGNPATSAVDPLCVGQTYNDTMLVAIKRSWPSLSDQTRSFANGATVTVSVATPAAPVSAAMGTDATVLLPANWRDATAWPNGTIYQGDTATVNVSVTPDAPRAAIATSVVINLSATGFGGTSPTSTTNITRGVEDGKADWTAVNCDSTPPEITPNVTGTLGSNDWYTSNVGVTWTVVDNQSSISSSTGCGSTTINADTTGTVVTCSATSAGGTAQQSVTIKRDATQPVVNVTGVSDGATYTLGSVPTAGCTTSDATSGVQTNASLGSSGGPVGAVTATCSGALDKAGNSGSASATYTVEYAFTGFFQPVDNLPAFNQAKAGSAIPVKFSLGGDQGLSIFSAGSPGSIAIACDSSDPLDTIEQTVTSGSSGLSYDPTTNQYTYVWKTQKSWTGCRQLVVELTDGTSHVADFKFTR